MPTHLTDSFGRDVTYLRLSVTDRCDLRCNYCMAERMQFLPRKELLSFEELSRLCDIFIARGVKKIRLTGGEPLVRRGIMDFIGTLSGYLKDGSLEELTITTNATQLVHYAADLKRAGVRRLNISLDTLDPVKFSALARRDALDKVLAGIDAAQNAGLAVKINTVALKNFNEIEIIEMIKWAHKRDMDMTLIEIMPLGETGIGRETQFLPLSELRERLERELTLQPIPDRTGGPARYVKIKETGGRLGFITPLTQNFCAGCNRVRVTCTGQLYMCLGQSNMVDLRAALRIHGTKTQQCAAVNQALDTAMNGKPKAHDFQIDKLGDTPTITRHMSVTGG